MQKKYITSMPETLQTTSRRKQTAKTKYNTYYNTLFIINPFTKSQVYIIYFIQTSALNSIYEILTFLGIYLK